jgi:Bacteriocin-protection, YdeI or OmpD-Associated/Domain of unknown function (DUF1905)
MAKKEFDTELLKIPDLDAAYFCLPFDPIKEYGRKSHIKVKATIDGELYRGSLVDMGWGTFLGVTQAVRKKIGKNPGDIVHVTLEEDQEERIIEVPGDLADLFRIHPQAGEFFSCLSYTNRKEYVNWILSAKREETRKSRLAKTMELLLLKKKNPSDK